MNYRIDKGRLLDTLRGWNTFLKKKVHLVACGGTALTLLEVKLSTKDIDFVVPDEKEYNYLITVLKQLGYKTVTGSGWARGDEFIFELFCGKRVHTTELLESPLEKGNNILIEELSNIYLGVLNYYDILISKLFRASEVDIDDCVALIRNRREEIDISKLTERFKATSAYDVSEDKVNKNLDHFLKVLKKEGLKP